MENETLKIRNSIQPALIRNAVMKGTLLGVIGVGLWLLGLFLPVSVLKYWGLPLFLIGGGMITWGLLPYRRLRALENSPNELVAFENKYIQYRSKGKDILKIPIQSIHEMKYVEKGSEYGIGILLKDPIPEKILIHDTTFNIDKFQENSLVNYKSDLYFPYFSKRSFQELQNFQTSPILSE
jgi:hypothetical protein